MLARSHACGDLPYVEAAKMRLSVHLQYAFVKQGVLISLCRTSLQQVKHCSWQQPKRPSLDFKLDYIILGTDRLQLVFAPRVPAVDHNSITMSVRMIEVESSHRSYVPAKRKLLLMMWTITGWEDVHNVCLQSVDNASLWYKLWRELLLHLLT